MDLILVLRYRKAVTYGFHVLLGAPRQIRAPADVDAPARSG
ncbi:hypothetical protein ACFY36_08675 [Actinoplanes sp. NPDC000266]